MYQTFVLLLIVLQISISKLNDTLIRLQNTSTIVLNFTTRPIYTVRVSLTEVIIGINCLNIQTVSERILETQARMIHDICNRCRSRSKNTMKGQKAKNSQVCLIYQKNAIIFSSYVQFPFISTTFSTTDS